jgi:hypothetical protein
VEPVDPEAAHTNGVGELDDGIREILDVEYFGTKRIGLAVARRIGRDQREVGGPLLHEPFHFPRGLG